MDDFAVFLEFREDGTHFGDDDIDELLEESFGEIEVFAPEDSAAEDAA